MKKDLSLVIKKNNPFSKIIILFKTFIKTRILKKKNIEHSENINNTTRDNKIYIVEYDTDPQNTNYEDILCEDKIIRNSPYVKKVVNQTRYNKQSYTKEEKEKILKKYHDFLNNKIDINELDLDEIITMNVLAKEDIKIREKLKIENF